MNSIHINHLILKKLKEKDLKIAWLARQVGCSSNNLRKILKNNHDIYFNLLFRIAYALEEDFFVCCSQELKTKLHEKGKTINENNQNNDTT